MTDRERLFTSKLYIDKLVNGMNPFDGQELPEDTILNDVNLCRTFVFVSDILEQVIKNDCVVNKEVKVRKEPFRITEAQRSLIKVTEQEVGISTISKRILKVLDSNVKGIPGVAITAWLEAEGLLTSESRQGKITRIATDEGNTLGINTREHKYGDKQYIKTMYELSAQAFIIANLENIASFGRG